MRFLLFRTPLQRGAVTVIFRRAIGGGTGGVGIRSFWTTAAQCGSVEVFIKPWNAAIFERGEPRFYLLKVAGVFNVLGSCRQKSLNQLLGSGDAIGGLGMSRECFG